MQIKDCYGFKKVGNFLEVIKNWRSYNGKSGVYIIVFSYPIPRLMETSDILYIGSSNDLGKPNAGRFWNYHFAQKGLKDWQMKNYIQTLVQHGNSVFLYLCKTPPNNKSVQDYERSLLRKFKKEHWELPPWNAQG